MTWQEKVKDYVSELAILRYERDKIDRNYCIGMDEMKTEFEKEKISLHKHYTDIHTQFKQSFFRNVFLEILNARCIKHENELSLLEHNKLLTR